MAEFFGLKIADIAKKDLERSVEGYLLTGGQHWLVTANPEILLTAYQNVNYRKVIKSADILIADGVGLSILSWLFGRRIKNGRVTGVDLVEAVIKKYQNSSHNIVMIGGSDKVLQKATHNLSIKYGNFDNLLYYTAPKYDKYSDVINENLNKDLIEFLNNKQATILLVGLGAPKQEFWINYFLPKLNHARLAVGVGGSFDYISGFINRAPIFVRRLGLEWLWRLYKQPRRFGRIINAVIIFPFNALFYEIKRLFHVEQNTN